MFITFPNNYALDGWSEKRIVSHALVWTTSSSVDSYTTIHVVNIVMQEIVLSTSNATQELTPRGRQNTFNRFAATSEASELLTIKSHKLIKICSYWSYSLFKDLVYIINDSFDVNR